MSTENWRESLRTQGYAVFHKLTPESLVTAAREAIESDLRNHYDPERQVEYDNQSYCPDLRGTPVITALLRQSPISDIVDKALGWEHIDHDGGQIAIRRAHNWHQAVPPEPHIDGIPTGLNGLTGDTISNFTALVGVFLTKTPSTFAGNFTVWPGSHHVYERYFREQGHRATREGMPTADPGQEVQLICEAGDVVFCHYQLGHSATVNTSDVDRWAVYFRIWLRDIEERRWQLLTNIWEGWKL
ncbi:MAG: phytanoyl-CoA dioxygenase family protein [Acidobacteriota bacterium]